MKSRSSNPARVSAFTLLELLTVIVVIAILAVMAFPVLNMAKARVAKVKCISNLKNLHVAANLYVQQNGHWPQIGSALISRNPEKYAKKWNDALAPFGVGSMTFICPTTQERLGGPDLAKPENLRTDYISTPFDSNRMTPYRWATQPWFAERSDVHGNGNLLIMPDGSVHQLSEYAKQK